tara:strand:- start:874 stop:1050 length:177 start_codon:yes stop_codon:yes gene_type:complete
MRAQRPLGLGVVVALALDESAAPDTVVGAKAWMAVVGVATGRGRSRAVGGAEWATRGR